MPYDLARQATAARAASEFMEDGDRRLLIVDDDENLREIFCLHLGEDYHCDAASSADEALARMACESYALVISDVMMPGRNGVELLREIMTRHPETAVVMVSGVARPQRVLDAVRLGAYDYLIKPCDLSVLSMTVERALERRVLLRAARHYKLDLERRNEELRRSKAELQRLQAQIIQSEKMASLGQLAAGVAHELNNPAGFIYGNMELLAESARGLELLLALYDAAPLPAEVAARVKALKEETGYENALADLSSIIADCREGAGRIRDVVQNLRTFSRLDEAEFKKVDIHESIESTLRLLTRYYTADGVRLVRDYRDLPPVDCYAGQLNQVWLNLLVNAAYAVRRGGEVRIETRREDDAAVVAVSDTGEGIAPEHLPRIFDPFFTTKPVGEGTGLGLSVTYSIVERHRGRVAVASRPGDGTTFTVTIPIDAPAARARR
ncbi:MAG TPA: ATP-binding protein [Pyrinomonadaceae bacterium]|jgi:signal transduction histidine kinase|nr:ATP-binding protein [Pyrinomonadaceae bacterium]